MRILWILIAEAYNVALLGRVVTESIVNLSLGKISVCVSL